MQKNLQVMNEAINETRKALVADPQNAPAKSSLYEVLKQKIQFLQETIALMNEMWQGDAAGAAQIVDGGKS
jgi:CHASE3 domain sensor protein